MDRRTLLLAGAAFVVCALLAAALLGGGGSLVPEVGGGSPRPLLVRIENNGTRDATALVDVRETEGTWSGRSEVPVAANDAQEVRIARPLAGNVFVQVTLTVPLGSAASRGDLGTIVDPSSCRAGETMHVTFRADTSRGASFTGTPTRMCAR